MELKQQVRVFRVVRGSLWLNSEFLPPWMLVAPAKQVAPGISPAQAGSSVSNAYPPTGG
jgi:hypothetical protein